MNKKIDAKIQCTKCSCFDFTLRYVVFDGVKSVIAECKSCGRNVDYRITDAIELAPKIKSSDNRLIYNDLTRGQAIKYLVLNGYDSKKLSSQSDDSIATLYDITKRKIGVNL